MSNERVERDQYDRGIVPAETAARMEREGSEYKHPPEKPEENASDLHTTEGYTTDNEGLINNFAVEPEMYYEVPGDAKAQENAETGDRAEELHDINDNDETGKLTMEGDQRGKGSGVI